MKGYVLSLGYEDFTAELKQSRSLEVTQRTADPKSLVKSRGGEEHSQVSRCHQEQSEDYGIQGMIQDRRKHSHRIKTFSYGVGSALQKGTRLKYQAVEEAGRKQEVGPDYKASKLTPSDTLPPARGRLPQCLACCQGSAQTVDKQIRRIDAPLCLDDRSLGYLSSQCRCYKRLMMDCFHYSAPIKPHDHQTEDLVWVKKHHLKETLGP
nr:uncharacterized protein LOC121828979 [Peromyscus maniculatus bairdii]XP_042132924.1 uncharacterized protein LOC121828979 [Peromyscus maniculatus bairdii]